MLAAQGVAPEDEVVEEAVLAPYEELPFLEGPGDVAAELPDSEDADAPPVSIAQDQDAWAGLIRRMLAVYERVEEPR